MKPVNPSKPRRVDTRGLPEGYDPHMFYEYRIHKLQKEAQGLEWYLYKYIPHSILKSFAIAIDPTAKFKVSPGVITPENRTKYRATSTVLQERKKLHTRKYQTAASEVNYHNIGGCRSQNMKYQTPSVNNWTEGATRQEPLPDILVDTTTKTRLMGSKQGTLTMFKGYINSPPRSVIRSERQRSTFDAFPDVPSDPCMIAGGTFKNQDMGIFEEIGEMSGPGATLSYQTWKLLMESEKLRNIGLMQDNAIAMLKDWSPNKQDHALFRSIVELKDLPRSVLSLREAVKDFRQLYVSLSTSPSLRKIIFDLKAVAKDVPNEYLSYHFGWKQTYKDLMDLLAAPAKITKRLNFLIRRNGKPTTFRTKRNFLSGESDVSGFAYDNLLGEILSQDSVKSRITRKHELRLVINATFDFPEISDVSFQRKDFLRRMGIIPRATDVYNLIPWTWLFDYFTGLGRYIECIDTINSDPGLVNWGVLTCVTQGSLITDFQSKSRSTDLSYYNGVLVGNNENIKANNHTSYYNYTCETRRDISTILDVKTISDPSSLSAYQKSIIGALLAQRTDFSRGSGLKPKS